MNKRIILVGGGGHCKSVLDSLLKNRSFDDIAIVDVTENVGKSLLGIPYIGSDSDLKDLFDSGYTYAFITAGSIGNTQLRSSLVEKINHIGFEVPIIVDQTATLSSFAVVDKGVFIGKNVVVNAGASIGAHAIINSGAIIEHDCKIGGFAHVASGAILGGNVMVGEHVHVGSNATIRQNIEIGKYAIIGIGSVVTSNVNEQMLAYGNPCREVKPV